MNVPDRINAISGAALCSMVGSDGAVFGWNAAIPTKTGSLSSVFLRQVVRPVRPREGVDGELAVQTFRVDSCDAPDIVNQDHDRILITDSGYFIAHEKFRGEGHHLPDLPDSLDCLPFFSRPR